MSKSSDTLDITFNIDGTYHRSESISMYTYSEPVEIVFGLVDTIQGTWYSKNGEVYLSDKKVVSCMYKYMPIL